MVCRVALLLLLVGCVTASPTPTPAPTATPAPAADRRMPQRLAELESYLTTEFSQGRYPGMAAGVFTRDGLIWSKGFGVQSLETKVPVSPSTVFRVGSITKVFTGLTALQLRDEGLLTLDEPASRWVPELATVVAPSKDSPPITLRHLLTHTSGLTHEANLPPWFKLGHPMTEQELLDGIRGAPLAFSPGTGEAYSNAGFATVGLILARASKQPYPELVRQRLLEPLGMRSATFERDSIPASVRADSYVVENKALVPSPLWLEGAAAARGGLYASLEDLARFGAFELSAWPPRDDPEKGPVRRSTVRESQQTGGLQAPSGRMNGLYWALTKTPSGQVVWHNGAAEGYQSHLWFSAQAGVGFIVLVNVMDDPLSLDQLVPHTRELLLDGRPVPLSDSNRALLDHALSALNQPESLDAHATPEYAAMMHAARFEDRLRQIHDALGPCTLDRVLEAHDTHVHAHLRCGAQVFDLQADAEPRAPFRIQSWLVRPQ